MNIILVLSAFSYANNTWAAAGACNYGYVGCESMQGNVACSNCTSGFTGRYGYADWLGAGYCCIDTNAITDRAALANFCYGDPTCTLECEEYIDNKRYCYYNRSFDYSWARGGCSTNLNILAWPYVKSCNHSFYQCAPGYMWESPNGCGSATTNYGEQCTCVKGCGLTEYLGFSQSEYDECEEICENFDEGECLNSCEEQHINCIDKCYAEGGGWDCINTGCYYKNLECQNRCNGFSVFDCLDGCGMGCRGCPVVDNDQSGNPLYGWGADSQSEIDDGVWGHEINSCRAVAGREFYDTAGAYEYTSTCMYSE